VTHEIDADTVTYMGLQAMGRCIVDEVGPDVAFALFVDWRDGRPSSYLSNAPRRSVAAALAEWLDHAGGVTADAARRESPAPTPLQAKAVALVRSLDEEDVGALLFLFGGEPGEDGTMGETAWVSSVPDARARAQAFVAAERGRS
jgi:hypothetical protein